MNKSLIAVGFALASMVSMSANAYTDMWSTARSNSTYVHTSSGPSDDGFTNIAWVDFYFGNHVEIVSQCKKPSTHLTTESVSVVNGQKVQTIVECYLSGNQTTRAKTNDGRKFLLYEFVYKNSVTIDGKKYSAKGFRAEYDRVHAYDKANTAI